MSNTAKQNTDIYRKIFACTPDDNVQELKDVDDFLKSKNHKLYETLKEQINGNIIEFPLDYMKKYNMKEMNIFQNESLVPERVFT